jgi:alpha-ribazole phosphatase/probable phosphoglycerate mutase
MQVTIDFLRHGEAKGGRYYRGRTDDPLTALGWQQMETAVANQQWDHIISSPLCRCLDFAQDLSQKTNIPLSQDAQWQEIDFGDWEGKAADEIDSEALTLFYQNPVDHFPNNGEPYGDFQRRINCAWDHVTEDYPDQHILVITHGGVIRSLFPLLLSLPVHRIFNLQVDLASLTRFQCFKEGQDYFNSLIFHNYTLGALTGK